jgi:predicted ATP-dependent Lon-type protease
VALWKTIAKKNTTTDVLRTLNPDIDERKLKLRQVLKYQQASKRRVISGW